MVNIPSPQKLLAEYGLTPKHSFGQNFLSDANLAGKIAELATPSAGLCVLEIGAGLGALTDQLLQRGNRVTAVERDRDLVPALESIFAEQRAQGMLRVLEADAKGLDWAETLGDMRAEAEAANPGGGSFGCVLAGNLPYQITGPLIEKTVHLGPSIECAVYLVQKEVADRLAAEPGSKIYGALSVFVQAQFAVQRALVIKAGAFVPKPRVDSAVVVLRPHAQAITEETTEFRQVVKSAFAARRKTLRNAWKGLLPAEELSALAESCGIDLNARGETLNVTEFANVARKLALLRGSEERG